MERQETIHAPEVAWLLRRAASGDGRAWERLVSHYEELVAVIHGAGMTDDETVRGLPGDGPQTGESLRAAAQTAGNAPSCLPPRWRQLLQLLSADPSAQHVRQPGR